MNFPGIRRAALEIAYDNGGINRHRSEAAMLKELGRFLASQPSEILPDIDRWLNSLSDDEMQTVCCGDQFEQEAITKNAPPFTNQFLDDCFNEVC